MHATVPFITSTVHLQRCYISGNFCFILNIMYGLILTGHSPYMYCNQLIKFRPDLPQLPLAPWSIPFWMPRVHLYVLLVGPTVYRPSFSTHENFLFGFTRLPDRRKGFTYLVHKRSISLSIYICSEGNIQNRGSKLKLSPLPLFPLSVPPSQMKAIPTRRHLRIPGYIAENRG